MTDLRTRYLACWDETDPEVLSDLLVHSWAQQATYVDPLAQTRGLSELMAVIRAAQQQFPGWRFSPVGEVETHHDVARFGWGLGPADAVPVILGSDVVTLDPDGRIATVTGFLDRVPA